MAVLEPTVQEDVLATLRENPLRPTELVRKLIRTNHVDEREIENALSRLLDDETVTFESDGLLHAAQ
jgi:hypothetical protein